MVTTKKAATLATLKTNFRFDPKNYSSEALEAMQHGGNVLLDAMLHMQKRQQTVVSNVMPRKAGELDIALWDHYPKAEVTDASSAKQYYYHSHRKSKHEHGHFHLFGLVNADGSNRAPGDAWGESEAPSHLIAIAMNAQGLPMDVFCTNQWVTKGHWLPAEAVLEQLRQFTLPHAPKRWSASSRWLSGFVQLFWPQIELAVHERDRWVKVQRQSQSQRMGAYLEDERFEVINRVPVDLHKQIAALEK